MHSQKKIIKHCLPFDLTPNSQPKSGKYFNDASSTTLQLKNKKHKKKEEEK